MSVSAPYYGDSAVMRTPPPDLPSLLLKKLREHRLRGLLLLQHEHLLIAGEAPLDALLTGLNSAHRCACALAAHGRA